MESKDSRIITTIHHASELSPSFFDSSKEISGEVVLVIIESVDESIDVASTLVLEIPEVVIGISTMEGKGLGNVVESVIADVVSGRLVEVGSERLVVNVELGLTSGRVVVRSVPVIGEWLGRKVGESDPPGAPVDVELVSRRLVVKTDSLVVSSVSTSRVV